jgi:hypothetical protein
LQRSYWGSCVSPSWSPHPHSVSPQSIGNTRKARHVNPIGQTETRTTKGHSAQVRNLHVNNRRLWCNFSEVPGELLMGPGQVVRSYDLPTPHVRPRGCVDRRLRRLLRSIPSQPQAQRSRFEIRLSFPFRVGVCLASSLGPRHQD